MQGAAPRDELPLVLLVDDDVALLRSFERMVRRMPIRLVTAVSGEEALAVIARDGPPALLISDYQLAGMDGLSLLAKVRLQHPGVRVVLSSGTTKTPATGSGIGVLPKPVEAEALDHLIASLDPRGRSG